MKLQDPVELTTGASRGIDWAIPLAYAGEGAWLALAARTRRELEETARQAEALGAAKENNGLGCWYAATGGPRIAVRQIRPCCGKNIAPAYAGGVALPGDRAKKEASIFEALTYYNIYN